MEGYYIVRCSKSGVFAGNIKAKNGDEVTMTNARRIWYWDGAASLSQLAIDGTNKPFNCKFPAPVAEIILIGVIEIIKCTPEAEASIKAVSAWKA